MLTPGALPQPVGLEGDRVSVVPLDLDLHADQLFAASHERDAELTYRYLLEGPFPDRASYRRHLAEWLARPAVLAFALVDRRCGQPFGMSSYMRIDAPNRVLEIGYVWFSPLAQRRAAATEAMFLMARHVFETLGYRRYEWKCDDRNERSRRAAGRLGFTFEGIFRNHMIVRGANRDTAWFSMTDDEWPSRREAFVRWLSPANFDAEGRQRQSLGALRQEQAHEIFRRSQGL